MYCYKAVYVSMSQIISIKKPLEIIVLIVYFNREIILLCYVYLGQWEEETRQMSSNDL